MGKESIALQSLLLPKHGFCLLLLFIWNNSHTSSPRSSFQAANCRSLQLLHSHGLVLQNKQISQWSSFMEELWLINKNSYCSQVVWLSKAQCWEVLLFLFFWIQDTCHHTMVFNTLVIYETTFANILLSVREYLREYDNFFLNTSLRWMRMWCLYVHTLLSLVNIVESLLQ